MIPPPRAPDGNDAWYESEQPIRFAIVEELKRIKRRSRARIVPILAIAILLTAGLMYKRARKVKVHDADVTIAVTEGMLADGHIPMPVLELREYISSVLLSNAVLQRIIEEEDLFPLRHKMGMEYAINELRDLVSISVHRNYLLDQYSIDSPRSARISIEVSDADAAFARRMARKLAELIVAGEQAHRQTIADAIARQAGVGLASARDEATQLEKEIADRGVEVTEAELAGHHAAAGALKMAMAESAAKLREVEKQITAFGRQADAEEMAAAIDRAGLGMRFDIVEGALPVEEPGARLYIHVIFGTILFCAVLPLVALFVGAFDTRIHDREDAERIGLPVIGHLPGFPGDRVGSLRDRGLRGRRVPS